MSERSRGILMGAVAGGVIGSFTTALLTGSGALSAPSAASKTVPAVERLDPFAICNLELEPVAPTKLHEAGNYILKISTTSDRLSEVLTLYTSSIGPNGNELPNLQTTSMDNVPAGDNQRNVHIRLEGDQTQPTIYTAQGTLRPIGYAYNPTPCTNAVLSIEPTYIGAPRPTAVTTH